MKPGAILKAEALQRHVQYLGVPPREFLLAVTPIEAYELLDYLEGLARPNGEDQLLLEDIARARKVRDPWPVLEHFQLLGFPIAPAAVLH